MMPGRHNTRLNDLAPIPRRSGPRLRIDPPHIRHEQSYDRGAIAISPTSHRRRLGRLSVSKSVDA
jgi:hypothetical protein